MNEYMLLIHNDGDGKAGFSPEQLQQFLQGCMTYIDGLKSRNALIAAQPMKREGVIVSGSTDSFFETPFAATGDTIVGYYHVRASGIEEAVAIAKGNPEFAFVKGARIEVRPLKTVEPTTRFDYPSGN